MVATEVDQPRARYLLQPDGTLVDNTTDSTVDRLGVPPRGRPEAVELKLWKTFGLGRINATRFDDAGDKKRLDEVPDDVLARTLVHGSDPLREAAAKIVEERLQVSERFIARATMGGYGPKLYELKQNSAELGAALIKSRLLRSTKISTREGALRAAAAIPSAGERLMPAVMAAMADIVVPEPLSEVEHQLAGRLDSVVPGSGRGLFSDRTPRPGNKFIELLDSAALAAARFGPGYAEAFVTRYKAEIVSALRNHSNAQGIALAVATAASGATVVSEALPLVDAYGDGYVLWNVAAILAARSGPPSTEVMAIVRSRCDTPSKAPNRRFSAVYCDSMKARAGDLAALDRLSRMVVESRPEKAGETDPPADEAAYALLFDAGPEGIKRLRSLAITAEPKGASIALRTLCHLGPDAGPEVIARALALASVTANAVTRPHNPTCFGPERTPIGRFVDAPR